jgi:LEA14-like dessication related protein
MKRAAVLILGIVILGAITVWIIFSEKESWGRYNPKPSLSIAAVSIKDIDEDKIKMTTKVVLNNPLPVDLKSNNLKYNICINGTKIMETAFDKPITISSTDSSSVEVPMEVPLEQLMSVLKTIDKKNADSADYTLNAWLELDLPVAGKRTFHFDHTMRLPAVQMPKIEAGDIDVRDLRWNESTIAMDMTMTNPNAFPIKMKDMKYNVVLGDEMPMEGYINGVTVVEAKSTSTVPVLLKMKNKEMGKLVWKALFDKDNTPFAINTTFKVVSESEMLADSRMAMRTTGTLKEIKRAAQKVMKK